MENKIDELTKENQKLKEMVALKSNLISVTAHNLRTSATALKWILKMLIDKDAGQINQEQETLLGKAYESNERSIEMIGEFFSANQGEDATITYKFEESDPLKLLEGVISDFSPVAFKQGVSIAFARPAEKIPYLKMDEAKIRIVFQNLLDNAIKYSNAGGKVTINMRRDGDTLEFSFQDEGIGISDEDQKRIFEKFFRADNAKQKKTVGTGLGLSTVKEIVEKHGGKIWFQSRAGAGTTFYFTLPA